MVVIADQVKIGCYCSCSGPKRFEYDVNTTKWHEVGEMDGVKNTRKVDEDINALLTKELKTLLGVDLKF